MTTLSKAKMVRLLECGVHPSVIIEVWPEVPFERVIEVALTLSERLGPRSDEEIAELNGTALKMALQIAVHAMKSGPPASRHRMAAVVLRGSSTLVSETQDQLGEMRSEFEAMMAEERTPLRLVDDGGEAS